MRVHGGWRRVMFWDVVRKVNDKVLNRDEWTFDKYIGGEHFDEGEIRVTKSAPIKGNEEVIGSAFHMRFKPGHVLYVTRNPRLRKGGMVDFEGVCSNVSFVLEADKTQLLQSLLPFIIQTEDFVKHTTNNAHGSTNPFLNWKDIAKYEFLLPKLEEQKKISEVLWVIEESINKIWDLLIKISQFEKTSFINQFFQKENYFTFNKIIEQRKGWNTIPLKNLIKYKKVKANPPYTDEKYVSLEHIEGGNRTLSQYSEAKNVKSVTNIFNKGDILYGKLRPNLDKITIPSFDGICTTEILVLNSKKKEDFQFVFIHLTCERFKNYNVQMSYGTKMPRTSDKIINKYLIPYPPKEIIGKITKQINNIHDFRRKLKNHLIKLKDFRKKLSNELLSGKLRLK